MNKIILTKKGGGYRVAGLFGGIFFLITGVSLPIIFSIIFVGNIPSEMIPTLTRFIIYFIAIGSVFIVINGMFLKGYADFYKNYVRGKYISKE